LNLKEPSFWLPLPLLLRLFLLSQPPCLRASTVTAVCLQGPKQTKNQQCQALMLFSCHFIAMS
jgi:hypothetical protein